VRPAILVLLASVCLVLLIASANVATLLLVRAESRRREMAIRTALGASGARVVRQLLTEGLVLAMLGGAAGLALAAFVPRIGRLQALASLPRFSDITVDWRVAVFAGGISLVTAFLFTLAPALQRREHAIAGSRRGFSGATGSRGSIRVGRSLATVEVALASMVLIVALVLGRSFARILDVQPGFDTGGIVSARVALPPKYATASDINRFFDRAVERVGRIPGVEAAAAVTQLPLSGAVLGSTFTSRVDAAGEPVRVDADLRGVTPDYFDVMGIQLVDGRRLTAADTARTPRVAVVDEAMARRVAGDGRAVGRKIRWIRQVDADIEVIGVVRAVRHRSLDDDPRPTVYRPHTQYARSAMFVVARGSHDAVVSNAALTAAIQDVDSSQPVSDVATMDVLVKRSLARPGFGAAAGGALAALALSLAAVGTYGLFAFVVAQRTREVGVRMAIGATRREITWMILSGGARLAFAGVVLGLAGAVALGRWMSATIPGVAGLDASIVCAAAATVIGSALLACWLPARRASRVDPSLVLRREA
jgi:putative ABC transport system permease protein